MKNSTPAQSALYVLIIVQLVMLFSMLFQAPPHPPYAIPLFAMGPFLAASLSACFSALLQGGAESRSGKILGVVAVLCAMVSYGPHKWFDAATPQIWPAVLTAQIASAVIIYAIISQRSATRQT